MFEVKRNRGEAFDKRQAVQYRVGEQPEAFELQHKGSVTEPDEVIVFALQVVVVAVDGNLPGVGFFFGALWVG